MRPGLLVRYRPVGKRLCSGPRDSLPSFSYGAESTNGEKVKNIKKKGNSFILFSWESASRKVKPTPGMLHPAHQNHRHCAPVFGLAPWNLPCFFRCESAVQTLRPVASGSLCGRAIPRPLALFRPEMFRPESEKNSPARCRSSVAVAPGPHRCECWIPRYPVQERCCCPLSVVHSLNVKRQGGQLVDGTDQGSQSMGDYGICHLVDIQDMQQQMSQIHQLAAADGSAEELAACPVITWCLGVWPFGGGRSQCCWGKATNQHREIVLPHLNHQ